MKIHEYQAKELLGARGIPVPRGIMVQSEGQATEAARKLIEEKLSS